MDYDTLPDWLKVYFEKELGECWVFYRTDGKDFTDEEYTEIYRLNGRVIPTTNHVQLIGVEIRIYKTLEKKLNSEYQWDLQCKTRQGKRR